VHPPPLGGVGFDHHERIGIGHLKDEDLIGAQAKFRDAVRVWIMLASSVRSVPVTPGQVSAKKARMLAAFTLSSAPWSITLTRSVGPSSASVTCMPPVPKPRAMGISRLA
jgi:hypothetical protein